MGENVTYKAVCDATTDDDGCVDLIVTAFPPTIRRGKLCLLALTLGGAYEFSLYTLSSLRNKGLKPNYKFSSRLIFYSK